MNSWDSHFKLGSFGRVAFDLDWTAEIGDRTFTFAEVQLGTQTPIRITSPDVLATIVQVTYRSTAKGVFNLVIRAGDSAGCAGSTGAVRQVRVN